MAMKKIYLLACIIIFGNAEGRYRGYIGLENAEQNIVCVGAWNSPCSIENLPLIFQGEIIKNIDGAFSFKLPIEQQAIGLLFVDIQYLRFEMDGNNVTGLKIAPNTPGYEFYILSKDFEDTINESFIIRKFIWYTEQQELPLTKHHQTYCREIPLFTLIIPISGSLFEHDATGKMVFATPTWDPKKQFVQLPLPTFLTDESTIKKLQKAILNVFCALPDLRPIHNPQEEIVRTAGPIEVSFVK